MRLRAIRRKLVPAVALLGLTGAVFVVVGTSPAGAVTFNAVSAPLPADAVAGQGMSLVSDSCPGDGWCVAVGNYPAQEAGVQYTAGLIVLESGGTSTALEAPLPANANASDPQALLTSVDCPQEGWCVAVGRYLDSTGATQGLIEQLTSDMWTPSTAPVPAASISSGFWDYTNLNAVSCPTVGWCAATGVYQPPSGYRQVLADTLSGGSWSATAPPVATIWAASQFLSLSCPSAGSCVGTAEYEIGSTWIGMVETLAGGAWTESALPLPAGASGFASIFGNALPVSCPAAGTCVVAGTAFDGTYWGFLDTLSGGTWAPAYAPQPAGVTSFDVQLAAVSCSDASFCIAVGSVNSSGNDEGLIESLSSGSWAASIAPAPSGTDPSTSIDLHDVNCPMDSSCVAVGQLALSNNTTGEMLSLDGSTWSAQAAPLPADAMSNPDPIFAPLSCPSVGACVTAGTYVGASGREGVIEEDPSLEPTTTTVSMGLVSNITASYSASVSGGDGAPSGTVAFSSGPRLLCVATLSNGAATCYGAFGPASTVVASYSGDATDASSWGSAANAYGPVAITATWGTPQGVKCGKTITYPLIAQVTNANGVMVSGVPVTFVAPSSGASGTFSGSTTMTTNFWGQAIAPTFKANSKAGTYNVVATAPGIPGAAVFTLTNQKL